MRKIKILHLLNDYFPRIGGIPSRVQTWGEMTSDVFDNHIIYPFYEPMFDRLGPNISNNNNVIIHRFDFHNGYEYIDDIINKYSNFLQGTANTFAKQIRREFKLNNNKLVSRSINQEMVNFIKNFDFDVMIGYHPSLTSLLPPFIRKDIPFIYNEQVDIEFGGELFTNEVKNRINSMFLFHKFGVDNQKTRSNFPVYYVPQQINTNVFKPIIPLDERNRFNLLFAGRIDLSHWEIIDKFVSDVLSKLPEKYHLTLFGRANTKALNTIYNIAKQKGIEHRIHYIKGEYDPVKINKIYNKHVFTIRPSTGESYGRFAMESMAAGCTFIGINHWGYDWATTDYMHKIGGTLDTTKPRTIINYDANYIKKLQNIVDNNLTLNGRKLMLKQNDWKAVKQKYIDIVINTIKEFKEK